MNMMILVEKVVGLAVVITAITVGYMTIHHGDTSLGMLLLLGQAQSLLGRRSHSGAVHEATHIAVHKRI